MARWRAGEVGIEWRVRPRGAVTGPEQGDRTEAAVLDSTWELVSRKGFTTITVAEPARAAGIARSSLYFGFKEAVMRALAGEWAMASDPRRQASPPARDGGITDLPCPDLGNLTDF